MKDHGNGLGRWINSCSTDPPARLGGTGGWIHSHPKAHSRLMLPGIKSKMGSIFRMRHVVRSGGAGCSPPGLHEGLSVFLNAFFSVKNND